MKIMTNKKFNRLVNEACTSAFYKGVQTEKEGQRFLDTILKRKPPKQSKEVK